MVKSVVFFGGVIVIMVGCTDTSDTEKTKIEETVSSDEASTDDNLQDSATNENGQKELALSPLIPQECEQNDLKDLSLEHTYGGDAVYADLAVHHDLEGANKVALLGNSSTEGVFVEIGQNVEHNQVDDHFWLEYVAHFATDASTDLVGRQVVACKKKAEPTFLASLCDSTTDACFLYSATLTRSAVFAPVENGEIPSWLGTKLSLLFVDKDIMYVAGNGVARFDGKAWHEEIPPAEGLQLNAIDSIETLDDTIVVAVGDNGMVTVLEKNKWTPMDAGTSETLLSVRTNFNSTDSLTIEATGTGGTVLTGDTQHLSFFTLGSESFEASVRRPGHGNTTVPDLITTNGTMILFSISIANNSETIHTCRASKLPQNWLAMININCGLAENFLHLAKAGLYFTSLQCAE